MNFDSDYLKLGPAFYRESKTAVFSKPELLLWNDGLANQLKLPKLSEYERATLFSGQSKTNKDLASLAYAGHQFGHFNPQLGDGRAHLLGDIVDRKGQLWELHMKGSGPTPFSRGGDGFCALGPALREYIMSEAMHALNVPSCKTLCVVLTGETLARQTLTRGAVVTRAAASHIRIGTFQYFAAREDYENLNMLADFTIARHYPELMEAAPSERYPLLLEQFIQIQISLVCHWLRVGFIHGVMNTDNMTLSGQTIDYGPCAMLEAYDPEAVFSSIDHGRRYAFASQADIAYWNTVRFAECLLPLIDDEQETPAERLGEVITEFGKSFQQSYQTMLHSKLGIKHISEDSQQIVEGVFTQMQNLKLDYTTTFTHIRQFAIDGKEDKLAPELVSLLNNPLFKHGADVKLMTHQNPVIIPRNHLVESAIYECETNNDINPTLELIDALRAPYSDHHKGTKFDQVASDGDKNYVTYCGT